MIKFLGITGIQGSEKRKDVVFEEIILENFPKQVKYIYQTKNQELL